MTDNAPLVLVVDDESRIRDVLVRWLGPAGYRTQQAGDAKAALECAAAEPPAAALCDIEMPGFDGNWLVARMRERFPHVGIVLATAVDLLPPQTTLRDGVVGYVLKPFDREQVLGGVRDAVAWHRRALARAPQSPAAGNAIDDWLNDAD